MSRTAATRIADYLTTGFYADRGYSAGPFDKQAGDPVRVWLDVSGRVDLDIVELALDAWSSVTGFRFVLNGRSSNYDIRLTDDDSGAYSYSYHSGNGSRVSAVVNVGSDWLAYYGDDPVSYYTQTWIHEIGHALGLGHAGPYNGSASWGDQAFALDSWQMSVMSYFSPSESPNVEASWGYVLTPMPADIIAIHDLYGAPTDRGADVYGFNSTASGIYAEFGALLAQGETATPILLTIWDGGGQDMLDLSRSGADQRIDLRQGAFSDVLGWHNTLGIAYGTVIEDARGGSGDDEVAGNGAANRIWGYDGSDVLRGNGGHDRMNGGNGRDQLLGGSGNDTLNGHNGNDVLSGALGNDLLIGGAGADRFVFRGQRDHGNDRIADFTSGEDVIDLRGLGIERMTRHAGALVEDLLRIVTQGEDTRLCADLDGDGVADLDILALDCSAILRDDLMI